MGATKSWDSEHEGTTPKFDEKIEFPNFNRCGIAMVLDKPNWILLYYLLQQQNEEAHSILGESWGHVEFLKQQRFNRDSTRARWQEVGQGESLDLATLVINAEANIRWMAWKALQDSGNKFYSHQFLVAESIPPWIEMKCDRFTSHLSPITKVMRQLDFTFGASLWNSAPNMENPSRASPQGSCCHIGRVPVIVFKPVPCSPQIWPAILSNFK